MLDIEKTLSKDDVFQMWSCGGGQLHNHPQNKIISDGILKLFGDDWRFDQKNHVKIS